MLNLGGGGQWVVREGGFRPADTTNLYRAVGRGYYRLAPVQNVGITLDWVRNLVGATWDELYDTASRPRPAGALRFDPHLTAERWSPAAAGAWTGLTLVHERADLMRSALDGVAALLRQRLDDLRAAGHAPRRVILGGGGAANPAWRALLEETLGLPLTQASTTWLTPAGAARLASRLV
jgi:xylulokinase